MRARCSRNQESSTKGIILIVINNTSNAKTISGQTSDPIVFGIGSGAVTTEQEVQEFVRARMARHKIPKFILFMESFPMTASGKIQKYKLREIALEVLQLPDQVSFETA